MLPLHRALCALLLPLLGACVDAPSRAEREAAARTVVRPPGGEEVGFRRVQDNNLWIDRRGVLVIREDSAWRALWKRYAPAAPAKAPPLDFSEQMVAAVSMGAISSCSSSASYVDRVERDRDSLFVVINYAAFPVEGGESMCMMEIAPVDLLVLPRSDLPVAFVGSTDRVPVPPPAQWLERYTVADTDTMRVERWRAARLGLARDSATSAAELAQLVDRLEQHFDPELYDALRINPRVSRDGALLQRLERLGPGAPGE
jgi:hypothetical protein